MRLLRASSLLLFTTLAACEAATPATPATPAAPTPATSPVDADEVAADRIRDRILGLDAESCVAEADALRAPAGPRLRALAAQCLSEAGRIADAEGLVWAMRKELPDEPWVEYAAIAVVLSGPHATDAALDGRTEALRVALADHPDALRLRARWLLGRQRADDVLALADAHPGPLQAARVRALFLQAFTDAARRPAAIAAAAALTNGVAGTDAAYAAAYWLWRYDRPAEAAPEVERALAGSPGSIILHRLRLDILYALHREAPHEVVAAIATLLERRPDNAAALAVAAAMQRKLGRVEAAAALEARLLGEFVASPATEALLIERLFAAAHADGPVTPAQRAARQAELAAFLARPRFHGARSRETAAILQFEALRDDPSASPEALLAAVETMALHVHDDPQQVYTFGVLALAERTPYLERAEALARAGLVALEAYVTELGQGSPPEVLKTVRDDMRCTTIDALGAVLLAAGRLDEAEVALREARSLSGTYVPTFVHLAELARRRGDVAAAEAELLAGLALDSSAARHPCEVALEDLYREQHGDLRGFPRHLERLTAGQREARKQKILATAIAEPAPVPGFALDRLDGVEVTSDQLRGKVVVIKFWYTGCAPCVRELPEFQALADAYARDPDVAVVSIYHDGERAEVDAWMRERGYTFAVLLAGKYCDDNKINSFPTLWVLDRDGRIAFTATGSNARLREEFTWRVESLRRRTG